MKAWILTTNAFPKMRIAYAAEREQLARSLAVRQARAAGYQVNYTEFKAARAPEFDQLAEACERTQPLGWEDDKMRYGCFNEEAQNAQAT